MNNIIKLPPFKKFCITIGNLPSSYLESMTYYECLCWFIDYLSNTIIPTIDNNSEVVEELQNKFTELQNFVNNYFNNLDVQEEINNKLDEMIESGELSNILNNYTQQQKVYNTTIDLLADSNLKENMKVKTLGYHNINDGGGANFYITSTPSNNFQLQTSTPGLFAELISNGILYIKQFGCVGDGVTDDTSNVQSAINELIKNENTSCLILNSGKYLLSSTITIRKNDNNSYLNKTIKGENQAYFTVASSFAGTSLIDIDGKVANLSQTDDMIKYLKLENINIQDRTTPLQDITGISIKSCQFINLNDVYIHSCKKHGLYLQDVYDSMVYNCKLIRCGFYDTNVDVNNCALMLTGNYDNVNATKFYGLQIEFFNTALQIVSGRHNQFTDCKFETGNYPNLGSVQRIYIGNLAIENTFTNCQFVKGAKDQTDDSGYFINSQTGKLPQPISKFYNKFDGCMFLAGTSLSGRWFACNNTIITNSILNSCGDTNTAKSPLLLTGNNIISNNHIINDRTYINLFDIQNNNNIISNNIIDMPNVINQVHL